jgi:hypothetical protein
MADPPWTKRPRPRGFPFKPWIGRTVVALVMPTKVGMTREARAERFIQDGGNPQ